MRSSPALLGCLLAVGCTTLGDRHELAELFQPHDQHAVQVAAMVVDLDTGETLLAREHRRLLRPASTMKVLTTASICRRDVDGTITTSLVQDEARAGGVTLLGGGDPFLSSQELTVLVDELASRSGGRPVDGNVTIVDPLHGAARFGEGWMWDDEPYTFMPALSAAAVDRGCVTIEARGRPTGVDARLLPVSGGLELVNNGGSGPLRVGRGRYRDSTRVVVSGTLEADRVTTRRLTVPDPARFTAAVLADELRRHREGNDADAAPTIRITNVRPALTAAAIRANLERPVADVVHETNKVSDNLGAELLLRRLGALAPDAKLDAGAVDRGLALIDADLEALGLDPAAYRIADGSGVSHYTLISAEVLVRTLADMHRRGGRAFEVFAASLPIAGRDGTLRQRMQGTAAEDRIRAKTGTISGVSNLAGYVTTRSGRHLAFAILTQNFVGSAKPWRELQDRFCVCLTDL
ncbi:MAG: D-alanyl-D-alanine carboxypeptidase/D-alanyl-D-alanine-endopeptidase [bacterium]|nr:D-alanyl-D-alanine carboxypeptidase/D-alanyl-D-alanine-endopeptidase [bacterium]